MLTKKNNIKRNNSEKHFVHYFINYVTFIVQDRKKTSQALPLKNKEAH